MSDRNNPPYRFFVGLDWGTEKHHLCLLRPEQQRPLFKQVAHSSEGYAELIDWLRSTAGADLAEIAVAIETPSHPLVDALLDAGFAVFSINPKQLDRFRDRFSPAGAKDDPRDALVLASSLRSDLHLFRHLSPLDPVSAAVREAFRTYTTLEQDLLRQTNRLRDSLLRFAPHLLAVMPLQDPCFWDLLELGLDPKRSRSLTRARVAKLLQAYRKRAYDPNALLAALRQPHLALNAGSCEEILLATPALLAILRATHAALSRAERRLAELLPKAGFEAQAIDSLPGAGVVVTAAFVGEAHHALKARDLESLRARCGTAPVTRRSGKSSSVSLRRACNNHLRNACWNMARTAAAHDPWARALYLAARQRGLGYYRALRGVADRLLTRLVALLRDGTLYRANYSSPSLVAAPST